MDDVSTHRMCNHAALSTEDQTQIIFPVDQYAPVSGFCVKFKHIENQYFQYILLISLIVVTLLGLYNYGTPTLLQTESP